MTSPTDDPAADVEQRCYRHPGEVTGVRCTRCDRPICPRCMHPASVGFQCPECVAQGNATTRAPRTVYGGRVRPPGQSSVVTNTLIGINIVVFLITSASGANFLSGNPGSSTIYARFALIPVAVGHGQWYRLFTAAFLHYGILHIGFNMYALYLFGPPLEAALGRLRFIVLYLLAGVGGSLLTVALGPLNEFAAGASGAIFGLFGAMYIVARHRNLVTQGIVITIAANLVFTFSIPNIDWRGHVGGLITGTIVALIYAHAPPGPRRNQVQLAGTLAVCVVLAIGGVLAVNRVNHECATTTDRADLAFCAVYDPSAVNLGTTASAGTP
jgi:membrane associated rhomboid family serine protease